LVTLTTTILPSLHPILIPKQQLQLQDGTDTMYKIRPVAKLRHK